MTAARAAVAVLVLLAASRCKKPPAADAPPAPPDPKEQFRKDLTEALRADSPDASISYDAATDELNVDGTPVFLGNMYLASSQSPQARRATIANVVGILASQRDPSAMFAKTFEGAAPNLLPRVRDLASRTIQQLAIEVQTDAGLAPTVERPLAGHLRVVLVYDSPGSVADVTVERLGGWGVDAGEAFRVALENLKAIPPRFEKSGPLYEAKNKDNLDAARLLLTDAIAALPLKGRPIAVPCARDALFIVGEKEPGALEEALKRCAEHEGGYPVSVRPVVLQGGTWVAFVPPAGSALADTVRRYAQEELGAIYAEEKELIDQRLEKRGEDVFVASRMVRRDDDGRATTMTTWGENVHSFIPRADEIGFVGDLPDGGMNARFARFDDVVKVMGPAMKRVDDWEPPWFEVNSWPTPAQLAAMRAYTVPAKKR